MKAHNMPVQGGVQLNIKALVIAFAVGCVIIYSVYHWTVKGQDDKVGSLKQFHTWKSSEFIKIPQNIIDAAANVKINERRLDFQFDEKKGEIYLQEANPEPMPDKPKVPVLLLHGAAFTSANWEKLNTIKTLAAFGHRVVAIDLPGWGKSKSFGEPSDKAKFLAAFIKQENLDRPVIVSPSMSGSFSIPYIMGEKQTDCIHKIRGFVPVAPAGTDSYTHAQWHRCEAPTMIVYGTEDKNLGLFSVGNLRNMPNSEIFPLQGAKHPAYLDKPDEWHMLLYNFLHAVEREHS